MLRLMPEIGRNTTVKAKGIMVTIDTFLLGLLVTSTMTSLVTEALKKLLIEHGVCFKSNTLAGVVSLILSTAIGSAYAVAISLEITAAVIVCMIALVIMSWLCAMVGYDKVIQTIKQFTSTTNKEE